MTTASSSANSFFIVFPPSFVDRYMLNRQKPQKPKITGIIHKYRTQINVNDFICYEFNIVPIFCKCNYNFPSFAIIYSLSNCLFVFLCILYVSRIVNGYTCTVCTATIVFFRCPVQSVPFTGRQIYAESKITSQPSPTTSLRITEELRHQHITRLGEHCFCLPAGG